MNDLTKERFNALYSDFKAHKEAQQLPIDKKERFTIDDMKLCFKSAYRLNLRPNIERSELEQAFVDFMKRIYSLEFA